MVTSFHYDEGGIVDHEFGDGDLIPLPTREQIANHVYAKKKKQDEEDDANNLDALEEYINENRWSEKTIKDHSLMFFFSIQDIFGFGLLSSYSGCK